MSSCCGSPNPAPQKSVPTPMPGCYPNVESCGEPACSMWIDPRLLGAPQTMAGTLMMKRGQGWYQLTTSLNGFVVCHNGKHFITSRPEVPLPQLRTFVLSETPGMVEATPEGVPLEDYPPPFVKLIIQNDADQWNSLKGPTDKPANLRWTGQYWQVEAPRDGQLKGPIELVDELVLLGTAGQSGCAEYEEVQRLNPVNDGFVISDGFRHKALSCLDEREAPLSNLEVFSLMACTSKGPLAIPLPATGIISMCNGNLVPVASPVYDARDQAAGTIPAGKSVGNFIPGATLETDEHGCVYWKRPSTTAGSASLSDVKLVFKYTGGQQTFTVPPGYTKMVVKVWGAGGSNDDVARGGVGGFTEGIFPVAGDEIYSVMVGYGPPFPQYPGFVYGFGGLGSPDQHQHPSGGLSGIFKGPEAITVTDDARAVAIAGAGAAGSVTNPGGQNKLVGGNGNAANGGGSGNFQGVNAFNGQFNGAGSGGGGFRGGAANGRSGRGGTGFLAANKISGSINASGDATVPGSSDPDYVTPWGASQTPGLVVVIFTQ